MIRGGEVVAVFCDCGSLMINENCSNKKCSKSSKLGRSKTFVIASFKQVEYIKELLEKLEESADLYDFNIMLMSDASDLIEELKLRVDLGI
jgi:adenylyl- and sulfurtransferase ThiI